MLDPITAVSTVGFPIFVSIYLLTVLKKGLETVKEALIENTLSQREMLTYLKARNRK